MSAEQDIKTIRELLGLDETGFDAVEKTAPPAAELPVAADIDLEQEPSAGDIFAPPPPPVPEPEIVELKPQYSPVSRWQKIWNRDYVRYPVIFAVSLAAFYLILNFQSIGEQIAGVFSPPPKNEEVVLGENTTEYDRWIRKYFVYASDKQVLSPNNDPDHDGLTNYDEFRLGTNPLKADTDEDGVDDGREIINDQNPLYEGMLTPGQSAVKQGSISSDDVQSRKDFQDARYTVSGVAVPAAGGFPIDDFVVDSSREGRVLVPKIGVDARLVWTKNFDYIQDDLKYGAAHHPQTVFPGEGGMSSIHGHSSGYLWDGDSRTVFNKINFLEPGDEIFIKVYGTRGGERTYRYVVRAARAYDKSDPGQFQPPASGYFLNLSTSWPIGTALQRFVVTTELAGI